MPPALAQLSRASPAMLRCMETDPHDQPDRPDDDEGSRDSLPPVPDEDDESPLGDTDQHSDADA